MEAALQEAMRLHRLGNIAEASRLYQEILQANPRHFAALCSLAYAQFQSGAFEAAQSLFRDALEIDAGDVNALCIRGVALLELKRAEEALPCFEAALRLRPQFADAVNNRATALLELGRFDEALAEFDRLLATEPRHAQAWNNRGNTLLQLHRFTDALTSFDRALAIQPGLPQAWLNRGRALAAARRLRDAVTSYDRGLALLPSSREGWLARGEALLALWRDAEALASFDRALAGQESPLPGALIGRGQALFNLGRMDEAIAACETLLRHDPDSPYMQGTLAFWRHCACDWQGRDDAAAERSAQLRAGKQVVNPWTQVVLSSSPEEQLLASRLWAADHYRSPLSQTPRAHDRERIRIAYLSADFRVHVTANLMAEIFEQHDRARFEVYGVSFGRNDGSGMRRRMENAFDRFMDVAEKTDREAAELLRAAEIDIAVDLKGYTTDSRSGILAARVAPVQVSYLGFPGTMGADHIDYLLADSLVVPEEDRIWYSEHIVTLPGSYYPYESAKPDTAAALSRKDAGLPEHGFVFCSFNSSYKITPGVFAAWMRLLRDVPDSVLWLLDSNAAAKRNLRREAEAHGVPSDRLIFAPFKPMSEHRMRYAVADLFLDTLPCNAHTTAADALWSGLPVLTCKGSTFAGRVAASLLHAAGLDELVTTSLDAYEALALRLARDQSTLQHLKHRLGTQRSQSGLFDSTRLCRRIEAAFAEMHERARRGDPPRHFAVPSLVGS